MLWSGPVFLHVGQGGSPSLMKYITLYYIRIIIFFSSVVQLVHVNKPNNIPEFKMFCMKEWADVYISLQLLVHKST